MDTRRSEGGFTMVEVLVVGSIMAGLLVALLGVSDTVTGSVSSNERAAAALETVRTALRRVTDVARPESAGAVRVRTSPTGPWIVPDAAATYPAVRFGTATLRTLEFVLDANETADGDDDDGDGLVDEGSLRLDGVPIATGVEACEFALVGQLFRVRLQSGRRDSDRRVHRLVNEARVCLRNG